MTYDFSFGSSLESMRASVHLSNISFTKQLRLTQWGKGKKKKVRQIRRCKDRQGALFANAARNICSSLPAHCVNVGISEHLVALFTDSIQSSKLGFVIDTHAAQADKAALMEIGCIHEGILFQDDGDEDEGKESCSGDRTHD